MLLQRSRQSESEQQQKSNQLVEVVTKYSNFISCQTLAAYWPIRGEISPLPLLQYAHSFNKRCYLPILHPLQLPQLWFIEYKPGDPLVKNRLGILEPILDVKKLRSARTLDLIMIPLVAFDLNGRRLGMGGGFYDRTFSFLLNNATAFQPHLLGLAYDFQQIHELPGDDWDIPLKGVATEKRYMVIDDDLKN